MDEYRNVLSTYVEKYHQESRLVEEVERVMETFQAQDRRHLGEEVGKITMKTKEQRRTKKNQEPREKYLLPLPSGT